MDRYQIDILKLSSILQLKTAEGQLLSMAPPFVEIYEERVQIISAVGDNDPPPALSLKIPILKDGIHRAWMAKEENIALRCIVVHGALRNNLPYAYPNAWPQVQLCDAKPIHKKYYRRKNPYSYMRPLKALRQAGDTPLAPEWGR